MRSSEIEAALGLTTGELRMALKWLSENGFVTGTKRNIRFNFGRQGFANKPLMFWTLTEKGRGRLPATAPSGAERHPPPA